jgi:hypothetical protein
MRNPKAWRIPSEIEPAFEGGIIQNQFIKGTLFIFQTNEQKLDLKPGYRQLVDGETSTMCFILGDNTMWKLKTNPNTDKTTESDWEPVPLGTPASMSPVGEWSGATGITDGAVLLKDTDAANNNGDFFLVTDAPAPVTRIYPGLFGGAEVTVRNGDSIISLGTRYTVLTNTMTWDSLNKPLVIDEYVAGRVIQHVHLAADITDLPDLLALKIDRTDVASLVDDNLSGMGNGEIISLGFLRKWLYFKSEVYTKAEVDSLFTQANTQPFNWERPIKVPLVGSEIPRGTTIREGLQNVYYG